MNARIRVGVVGLGQWGQHHVRIYHHLPNVDLIGVVDTAARVTSAFSRRYQTPGYRDYRELFGKADAVSLVAPTALHYEMAREFLNHGMHVLVEKPITTTVEQAAELVDLAQQRGLVLLVGHVERFKPAVQALREQVTEPLFVQVRRVRPWDRRRVMDVGVVLDLMIHDLDIILTMLRSSVARVSAIGAAVHGDDEDLAVAHLTLDNGCLASFVASRISPVKATELEITLPDGLVQLNYLTQQITVRRNGKQGRTIVKGEEPLRAELRHFVDCVRGEARPLVPGEHGLRALEVAQRILERMTLITPRVAV